MPLEFHCIEIFVNGETDQSDERPKTRPQNATLLPIEWTCAVDGGIRYIEQRTCHCENISWIGDGDSVEKSEIDKIIPSLKQSGQTLTQILLPKHKSLSDFAAALNHLNSLPLANNPLFAQFYGCKGGRFDHEMITYLEMLRWVQSRNRDTVAVFEHGIITNCSVVTELPQNSFFSVLANSNQASVTIEGALYSGKIVLERPSHGLSNIAQEASITLTPHNTTVSLLWNFTATDASK